MTTERTLRRLAWPLILGLALGAGAAALLGRALDGAVRERTRQDLASMLERFQADFPHGFPPGPELHEWVRLAARQSRARVTLIDAGGVVLSDSEVDAARLPTLENHLGRPEVVAARANQTGFAERRSASVVKPLLYVARRVGPAGSPLGYIRIAVPKSSLDAEEAPFRSVLTRTALGSGLLVALLVFVIRRRHAIELDRVREGIARAADGSRPDPFPGGTEEGQDVFVALTRFADLVKAQKEGSETARVLARTVFDEVPAGLVVVDRTLAILDVNAAALRLFGFPSVPPTGALVDLVRDTGALALFAAGASRPTGESPGTCVVRVGRAGVERSLELAVRPVPHGEPARGAGGGRRREGRDGAGADRRAAPALRGGRLSRAPDADREHPGGRRDPRLGGGVPARPLAVPRDPRAPVGGHGGPRLRPDGPLADRRGDRGARDGGGAAGVDPRRRGRWSRGGGEGQERRGPDRTSPRASPSAATRGASRRSSGTWWTTRSSTRPASSRVEVRAERDGKGSVLVRVVDRGIGIAAADHEKIFQRFYRVDPSRSKTTPGTGLGLAIVKHLLVLHEGAIHVDSEPGKGSTFTVTLPEASPSATQEIS